MRTGTRLGAAVMATALSACGGGGTGGAPPATTTPAAVAPPAYTTTTFADAGPRMAPISGDRLSVAVAADGRIGFASTFTDGIVTITPALSTFSGHPTKAATDCGAIVYGRGFDGDLYSGRLVAGLQGQPFAVKESTGARWTLVAPRCGAGCDPVLAAWPVAIVAGPDAATWVLTPGGLLRLNPDGTTTGLTFAATFTSAADVVVGPDNAFWVADGGGAIERVPLSGAPAAFPVGGRPSRIAPGADGTLWFIDLAGGVRRITTSGAVTTMVNAPSGGFAAGDAIAQGADRALWFTEANANKLGRATLGGAYDEFAVPTAGDTPAGIAAASDQSLYLLEQHAGIVVVHAVPSQAFTSTGF